MMSRLALKLLLVSLTMLSTSCGRISLFDKFKMLKEQEMANELNIYRNEELSDQDYDWYAPEEDSYDLSTYSRGIYERERENEEEEMAKDNQVLFDW